MLVRGAVALVALMLLAFGLYLFPLHGAAIGGALALMGGPGAVARWVLGRQAEAEAVRHRNVKVQEVRR